MPIFEPTVILNPENLHMDETSRVDSFCKLECGVGLTIGKFVHLASYTHVIGGGELIIGDYAACASGVKLVTGSNSIEAESCSAVAPANMQKIERGKVVIGKNAVLFVNAVVLPGCNIGEGAVIAAGAVVTAGTNVPDFEVWGGVPARKIKNRHNEDIEIMDTMLIRLPDEWHVEKDLQVRIVDHRGDTVAVLPTDVSLDDIEKIAYERYSARNYGAIGAVV